MKLKYNVFGLIMTVIEEKGVLRLFTESASGMKMPVYDVVFPMDIRKEEIGQYLDDIYHERATPERPSVFEIQD